MVQAVARVVTDAILGDAAKRVVERLDVDARRAAAVLDRLGGIAEHVDEPRIVDLQDEAGLDDAEVLLAHRLGDGVEVLLVVLVVVVLAEPAGAGGGHEDVGDIEPLARRLEVLDVDLQQLLAGVRDRALGR